ncbi:MAG: ribonuclease H-like domain-containing protein [Patescibacteria group bacterium]
MRTVIFDIETIPLDFDSFDETQKEYLLKFAEDEDEREKILTQLALWAPTNKIVAIGMLVAETGKGAVYFQSENKKTDWIENNIKYSIGTEKEILEKFWQAIKYADRFVTFNGRGFDCPVLMLKSAMLGVKISRNLMPYRYANNVHIDLLEQLTFYNSYRKFNLDFYCKAFEIKSPKSEGINGHEVAPLYKKGEYEKIAKYCAGDLFATKELFLKWEKFINI